MSHLEKAILKGKKFKKGELKALAREELKEGRSAKGKALDKMKC